MRRGPHPVYVLALTLACAGAALGGTVRAAHAGPASASAGGPVAPVVHVNGVPCVGAGDLARLLDGTVYWRPDARKLVVRMQGHRLTFTQDMPIVMLDDRTLRLEAPVHSLAGELQVPISLLALLPRDSSGVRLVIEPGGNRVRLAPAAGWVGAPRVELVGNRTRVTLLTARASEARVVARGRDHFRLWLPGAPGGVPPDSLPAGALVRGLRRLPAGEGVTWEFELTRAAAGWRLANTGTEAAVLEFGAEPAGLEGFAAEGPAGPRAMRVVVIDPGHGGADAGVTVTGALEKDLALQLAHLLASEIARRAGARVLLTRDDDRALGQPERAEIANRARADLVLSLHFDGAPLTHAHGATAWCAPVADAGAAEPAASGLVMTPWRDVALRWAVDSRALADEMGVALGAHGFGPVRVRERLPVALLGVNAPGLSLECATLTSSDDLARVSTPEGLRTLAAAIADGVLAWARHE